MSTSIDELFKSAGTSKRKLETTKNPEEVYKAAKLSANGTSRSAAVEEEEEDLEAGPTLPPDDDEVDDEEGRFFGGGVSKHTADVLDFLDEQDVADDKEPERIDSAYLRRLVLNFERRISKNAELRSKYEDDPSKFMASEADLDADVKALSILSEHPELYADFAKLGCVSSLVSLLAHENTDIAIDAIEIIAEMTDEDVQAQQAQWDALVSALLEADLPSLLVSNLARMDESNDSDRTGVYHTLSLIENLTSQPTLITHFLSTDLLPYLLTRIQKPESPCSQNKAYAAEILSILLQSSDKATLKATELDAVDTLLQLLAAYRKRDPSKGSDEEEYVENAFNALTILVAETAGKKAFLAAEGIELCLIMLREGRFSKPRALRLLDHALGGFATPELSAKLVEAAGLKTVFGLFMKQKTKSADFAATTEHVLGIFAALLSQLPGESPERIRVLAKFVEGEWEKVERLLTIRGIYGKRVKPAEEMIAAERKEATEEEKVGREAEWQSRRLDAGLYSYQTSCVVLAWLVVEDEGARKYIDKKLREKDESLKDIKNVLQDLLVAVEKAEDEEGVAAADMYRTLIEVLG